MCRLSRFFGSLWRLTSYLFLLTSYISRFHLPYQIRLPSAPVHSFFLSLPWARKISLVRAHIFIFIDDAKVQKGAKGSNHLTGCAADIRVAGMEQLVRYATILLDISDERQRVGDGTSGMSREDFDELLLERSPKGGYWLHFAVRPSDNRRKVRLI